MLEDLLVAMALVLILEGLLPALNPRGWRRAMEQLGTLSDRAIRRFWHRHDCSWRTTFSPDPLTT